MTVLNWIFPRRRHPETFPEEGKRIIFKLKGEGISVDPSEVIGFFEKEIRCENNKIIKNGFIYYRTVNRDINGDIYGIYFKGMPYILGVSRWAYLPE